MSSNRHPFITQQGSHRQHHAAAFTNLGSGLRDFPARVNQTSTPMRRAKLAKAAPSDQPAAVSTEAGAGRQRTSFWTWLWNSMMEGFVLYGASIHPTAILPDAYYRPEHNVLSRDQIAKPSATLPKAASAAGSDNGGNRVSPTPFRAHWRREHEVNKIVAALEKLDNRTLSDIGIPHRSQIEQVVRYGRDC